MANDNRGETTAKDKLWEPNMRNFFIVKFQSI